VEAGDAQLVLAVLLVALIIVHTYKVTIITYNFNEHVEFYWRILFGLGCVPSAIALYFRLTILETPRFTMDIDRDVQRAKADIENVVGPEAASASAVHWVGSDAVVHRPKAPRRS
jgi:PHS family inorganic phosphate transporter-like MFS transporter